LLLLDEPAAGLSREDKGRLAQLLRRIAGSGVAVVLVEHDMAVVMGISDRVVVLDAGMRIAAGTPLEVQRDPAVRKAYLGDERAKVAAQRTGEPGEALLEVGRLAAGYGAEPALKGIDLNLREREMIAVLGANGAGKSTLMRAISGLHRPVTGGIAFAREGHFAVTGARGGGARRGSWCPRGARCSPSSRCWITSAWARF